MKNKKTVMIVEDELVIALDLKYTLENEGYDVCDIITSGDDALKSIEEFKPDLVLMDIILEGSINGIEAADIIHKKYKIPVLFITALVDKTTYQQAQKAEPVCFLVKPYREQELISWVKKAFQQ